MFQHGCSSSTNKIIWYTDNNIILIRWLLLPHRKVGLFNHFGCAAIIFVTLREWFNTEKILRNISSERNPQFLFYNFIWFNLATFPRNLPNTSRILHSCMAERKATWNNQSSFRHSLVISISTGVKTSIIDAGVTGFCNWR